MGRNWSISNGSAVRETRLWSCSLAAVVATTAASFRAPGLITIALRISARLYIMGHGRIVFEGSPGDLTANAAIRKEWLEV